MPTIIAASLLDIVKLRSSLSSGGNIELLLIGFVVSFVVALVVVKWFISFLQKHSLASFGWYRITAGLLLILFGIK
jgi:undecaprenyl-diphosphatase